MFVPLKNFAADKVVITWGAIIFGGVANGTFVAVERANDAFTKYVGADGSVARARMADKSGSVTVTLMHTSPTNDLLSAQAKIDEEVGTAVAPLMVKDLMGNTLCMAQFAWIRKMPNVEYGGEISEREWVFDCDSVQVMAGGSLL